MKHLNIYINEALIGRHIEDWENSNKGFIVFPHNKDIKRLSDKFNKFKTTKDGESIFVFTHDIWKKEVFPFLRYNHDKDTELGIMPDTYRINTFKSGWIQGAITKDGITAIKLDRLLELFKHELDKI